MNVITYTIMLTEKIWEFCQVSPGPLPHSVRGTGYEAKVRFSTKITHLGRCMIVITWCSQKLCRIFVGSQTLIGASLSEPHTSMTPLRNACVCVHAWTDHLPEILNQISLTCTCTIIFKFNEPSMQGPCKDSEHLSVRRTMATTKTETTHEPTYSLARAISEP